MPGTGPFTVNAQRITTGVRLYFQSRDWQVAGRKIELVAEDDQGDPQVSLTQTQKLVERDRIHTLIEYLTTAVDVRGPRLCHAAEIADPRGVGLERVGPSRVAAAVAVHVPQLHLVLRNRQVAGRVDVPAGQPPQGRARWRATFGGALEPAFAYKTTFEKLGGRIVAEIKPPVATVDWAPWVAQIGRAVAEADNRW